MATKPKTKKAPLPLVVATPALEVEIKHRPKVLPCDMQALQKAQDDLIQSAEELAPQAAGCAAPTPTDRVRVSHFIRQLARFQVTRADCEGGVEAKETVLMHLRKTMENCQLIINEIMNTGKVNP